MRTRERGREIPNGPSCEWREIVADADSKTLLVMTFLRDVSTFVFGKLIMVEVSEYKDWPSFGLSP